MTVENLEVSIVSEQYFRNDGPRILPDMTDPYFEIWKQGKENQEKTVEIQEEVKTIETQEKVENKDAFDESENYKLIMKYIIKQLGLQIKRNEYQSLNVPVDLNPIGGKSGNN